MSTNKNKVINIDDWISQAEAARLRNISRQAINNLIKAGRIDTISIGGHTLVNRHDVESFIPNPSGRKKNITNG